MKQYQIIAEFLDPVQGSFIISGESEEDVANKLTKQLEEQVHDFKILAIQEIPSPVEHVEQPKTELTYPDNVLVFTGNKTKH